MWPRPAARAARVVQRWCHQSQRSRAAAAPEPLTHFAAWTQPQIHHRSAGSQSGGVLLSVAGAAPQPRASACCACTLLDIRALLLSSPLPRPQCGVHPTLLVHTWKPPVHPAPPTCCCVGPDASVHSLAASLDCSLWWLPCPSIWLPCPWLVSPPLGVGGRPAGRPKKDCSTTQAAHDRAQDST